MVVMSPEFLNTDRHVSPSSWLDPVVVADVAFANVNMEEAIGEIVRLVHVGQPSLVCTANLDHLFLLQQDEEFREVYHSADLVLADGMPLVWLSRLGKGRRLKERVAGSDLFWELGRLSAETRLRLFYLGGSPASAERAAEAVRLRHPGATICGVYCPPFEEFGSRQEDERIAGILKAARPDILLVGLGAPKQEKWIAAHKERLGIPVCIGVGGSFEMAAGIVRRAPRWMQRAGLEWSYRLCQEPSRLWRRYLIRDLPLLVRLAWSAWAKRYGTASPQDSGPISVSNHGGDALHFES